MLRWNSWDVFTNPRGLGRDVWASLADPLGYPHTMAMTVLLTGFLVAMYLTLYAFTRLDTET